MAIQSDRDQFVGVHVTPKVKQAIRVQASRDNLSVSEWLFRTVVGVLRGKGHAVTDEVKRP